MLQTAGKKCIEKYDVTIEETKLIPFSKQDVQAACDALGRPGVLDRGR
jgi:hypothetical protein